MPFIIANTIDAGEAGDSYEADGEDITINGDVLTSGSKRKGKVRATSALQNPIAYVHGNFPYESD